MKDQAVFEALQLELRRQRENVELIASENYVSEEVMRVQGSILTNKGKRREETAYGICCVFNTSGL